MSYFDWEFLFLQEDPKKQREKLKEMGLSEGEIVSRMSKILEKETLLPPLSMPGIGGGGNSAESTSDPSENDYVESGYVDNYFT